MKTFSIRFNTGCLELDALVTSSENHQKFKVEMVTGEPDPMILRRSDQGTWKIENSGERKISAQCFRDIEKEIDAYLENEKEITKDSR